VPLSASNCLLHQVRQRDEALRERSRAARALNALHAEKRELQWALGDLRTSPLRAWESPSTARDAPNTAPSAYPSAAGARAALGAGLGMPVTAPRSTASFASSPFGHSASILGNPPASFGRTSTPSAVASAYAHAASAVLGAPSYSCGGSVGASRGAGDVLGGWRGAAGASAAATATATTAREATSAPHAGGVPNWQHAETSLAFSEGHVVLRSPGALGSEMAPRLHRDGTGALGSEQQLTSRDNTEVAKEVLREALAAAKTPSTPPKSVSLGDGEAEAPR